MSATSNDAKVLVPLDGSTNAEQAIPYGRAIAGKSGQVTLLKVLPKAEATRGLLGETAAAAWEVDETPNTELRTEMSETTAQSKLAAELHTATATGDPKAQIVKFAQDNGYDYIVMASRGRGAVGRFIYGSVADAVARTTPVPVLIVHPKENESRGDTVAIDRLVVPLDGSDLARAALPVATELGRRLKLPTLLVHAIDPNFVATANPGTEAYYTADVYDQLVGELEDSAQKDLVAAAATLNEAGVEASWVVVNGGAIDSIEQRLKDGDVIIMTSHGRSGLKRWVMGSVSERLVRTGPAPVMLVPAPGRDEAEE
ncbi:MAG: universal stress protein [Thermomicrobiales bacterium]